MEGDMKTIASMIFVLFLSACASELPKWVSPAIYHASEKKDLAALDKKITEVGLDKEYQIMTMERNKKFQKEYLSEDAQSQKSTATTSTRTLSDKGFDCIFTNTGYNQKWLTIKKLDNPDKGKNWVIPLFPGQTHVQKLEVGKYRPTWTNINGGQIYSGKPPNNIMLVTMETRIFWAPHNKWYHGACSLGD
jgi:hypothetical protein